ESKKARIQEIPKAEKIIREEHQVFLEFLATLEVIPVIMEIRQHAEEIRKVELEKTLNRLPELSPDAQNHIVAMTQSIVNKIMHSPTVHLREKAAEDEAEDLTYIVRELFGINDHDHNKSL
ncbi:MAG: glutamyl-tRNA reductase, partial [Chloroflexi bacterium]|nr:glutamyl-tRNA reductase [Chloroflexota bacterium]